LNLVLSFVPTAVKAPMQTIAINPAIRPYSTAVAPYMTRSQPPAYRTRGLRREAAINDKVALLEVIFGLNRLANADRLDVEAALSFLNTLPYPLGTEIGDTIEHARHCVAAAPGGDHKHGAVARYAIKRIALVLERRLKDE